MIPRWQRLTAIAIGYFQQVSYDNDGLEMG
jgi:hypothetical protein